MWQQCVGSCFPGLKWKLQSCDIFHKTFSEIAEVKFHQACCVITLMHGQVAEAVIRGSTFLKTVQMKKLPCAVSSEPLPMSPSYPEPFTRPIYLNWLSPALWGTARKKSSGPHYRHYYNYFLYLTMWNEAKWVCWFAPFSANYPWDTCYSWYSPKFFTDLWCSHSQSVPLFFRSSFVVCLGWKHPCLFESRTVAVGTLCFCYVVWLCLWPQ